MRYRLLFIFWTLSLLLVSAWQSRFHLPLVLIPLHVIVAVLVHSICLISISLIYRWSGSRWLAALLMGGYLLLVSFFYLMIFGSVQLWGDIVTVKILATYFKDFGGFLRSMPFSYTEMVIGILIFIAIPFLIAGVLSRRIESALRDLYDGLATHRKIVLAILLVALLASPFYLRAKRFIHKRGEPLMVMLSDHMWGVTDNPLFTPRRIRVGYEDTQERKRYAAHSLQPRKNVVLIIVDALRADHLSVYGYSRQTSPFLDSLVASHRAAKVDRCYSTCACTLCGVTSILLSRTWNDCAVNGFNLIGLLRDQHYNTYALISGAHKEWYNMAKFYSDDCTMYYDGKDSKKYYFKDDRVLLEGLDKIRAYRDTSSMFYFHLQSTHETGLLEDKYDVYKPFKKSITTQGMNGEAAVNEYDNKVLQADDMIRQIFSGLAQKGYLKNSLVVITADHGQGLGEHGVSGHVDWLYDPQVSVPLIIYDDSLSLYHNLAFARHIDISPTIIDRLGLPRPASWMGLSLLQDGIAPYSYHETGKNGLETGTAKYMIVHLSPALSKGEGGMQNTNAKLPKGSLINSREPAFIYKYIFTEDRKSEELYEIMSDPEEKVNLCDSRKDVLDMMRSKAAAEMQKMYSNE